MTFMTRRMSLISALLVLLMLFGVACSGDDEQAEATETATEVAETGDDEEPTPTNEPTEEATAVPTEEPTEEPYS